MSQFFLPAVLEGPRVQFKLNCRIVQNLNTKNVAQAGEDSLQLAA
jgi:hypothetical protein